MVQSFGEPEDDLISNRCRVWWDCYAIMPTTFVKNSRMFYNARCSDITNSTPYYLKGALEQLCNREISNAH